MSQITLPQVLENVFALPPEDRAKLRDILNAPTEEEQQIEAARIQASAWTLQSLSVEHQWLKEHCHEYAGQWVALKGNQLVSSGSDGKAVIAAAREAGHPDAFIKLVTPEPEEGTAIFNFI